MFLVVNDVLKRLREATKEPFTAVTAVVELVVVAACAAA